MDDVYFQRVYIPLVLGEILEDVLWWEDNVLPSEFQDIADDILERLRLIGLKVVKDG